jgi:hypothetical protein
MEVAASYKFIERGTGWNSPIIFAPESQEVVQSALAAYSITSSASAVS